MRVKYLLVALLVAIVAPFAIAADDCDGEDQGSLEKQRDDSVQTRANVFSQAERLYPIPQLQNFPLRQSLTEFTVRQDQINHPWYIYIQGMNGNTVGYFVARTYPQNACNFLSSTEDVREDDTGNVVLTAPSLDGVYYGGGGSAGSCDAWFFFDYTTNAAIVIRGQAFFAADKPLALQVEPLAVEGQ